MVIEVVGVALVWSTYRNRLLVNDRNTLEDTRYEIAVAAKACGVLDAGSIQLEKPMPDPKKKPGAWKNTDVYGTLRGQPVRIEATVLHEALPPTVSLELGGGGKGDGSLFKRGRPTNPKNYTRPLFPLIAIIR